jgi:murein DD-endopeptidase MepM/ murein hydrolase activator NlpD
MDSSLFRVAVRLVAVVGILSSIAAIATSATAAPVTDEDRFTLAVFPHDTPAVSFWDSWGAPRSGGRGHRGTDILSPRGTEVLAVADGVVADFGTHHMSGHYIRLDHEGGWSTTYMHLNNDTIGTDDGEGGIWAAFNPTLTIGAEVTAGEVIGYVGDSGNAEGTQPHTHFEIKRDGEKINPYPFLEDVFEREQRTMQEIPRLS